MTVANAGEAAFVPTIDTGTSVLVRKVGPRVPVRTIVLPHCTPGSLAEIWPPPFPVLPAGVRFEQSDFFFRHGSQLVQTIQSGDFVRFRQSGVVEDGIAEILNRPSHREDNLADVHNLRGPVPDHVHTQQPERLGIEK